MKVVVNRCFGGFSLSKKAIERLAEIGNEIAIEEMNRSDFGKKKCFGMYGFEFDHNHKHRTDPDLIKVIEELGEEANGSCADLEIVEIPDDVEWEIDEYDGRERIAEKHRTW